jgi:hypothetical protein
MFTEPGPYQKIYDFRKPRAVAEDLKVSEEPLPVFCWVRHPNIVLAHPPQFLIFCLLKVCQKEDEGKLLVLCGDELSSCQVCMHTYCMRPALLQVPNGLWHCPVCERRRPGALAPDKKTRERRRPGALTDAQRASFASLMAKKQAPIKHVPNVVEDAD